MKIQLSKHAELKLKEREIDIALVEKVLSDSDFNFYDFVNRTFIAISKVKIREFETNLVVVYTKDNDSTKVITVYPCKNLDKELKRKEGQRWIKI